MHLIRWSDWRECWNAEVLDYSSSNIRIMAALGEDLACWKLSHNVTSQGGHARNDSKEDEICVPGIT
jgi:hypothetical protein